MHIGIDLDNTVLDATSSHLFYYNKVSGLSFVPEDVNDFFIYRLYGWSRAERDEIYHRHGHDIHWHSSPFPSAIEVLGELAAQHRLSIITARPPLFQDVTLRWLAHHGVPYHRIAFTENKLEACMEAKVDVLIDDAPHYAREFAERNRPVILFDQPYNRDVSHERVYRAAGWPEIGKLLDDIGAIGERAV
ncbi:5' nucleotidase, NT5C type [Paenibacillus cymbidii]|uniref:5' nucleotidase, NT5C type n=1 Tax=Paenibacillus cymbidii TaxID=1639034 RepID=UPI0014369659|nr:hypothetical protein [Paenibacillus cymbidii]